MARKKGYLREHCPKCLSRDIGNPTEWENGIRGNGGFCYVYKRCNHCGTTIKDVYSKVLAGETADSYVYKTEYMFSEI